MVPGVRDRFCDRNFLQENFVVGGSAERGRAQELALSTPQRRSVFGAAKNVRCPVLHKIKYRPKREHIRAEQDNTRFESSPRNQSNALTERWALYFGRGLEPLTHILRKQNMQVAGAAEQSRPQVLVPRTTLRRRPTAAVLPPQPKRPTKPYFYLLQGLSLQNTCCLLAQTATVVLAYV